MASDLITNFVGLFLKDRYEEIEDFRSQASDIQSEQLFNLLREAEDTEWGGKYDFKTIFSYQDFRERLPIQKIQDIKPYLEKIQAGNQNVLWPGIPKKIIHTFGNNLIPISEQSINETYYQGIYDSFSIYLHQNPESKLFGGYSVFIGDDIDEQPFMKDLFCLLQENEPFVSSLLNLPKRIVDEKDQDLYYSLILKEIQGQKISSFKGSPECLLLLMKAASLTAGSSDFNQLWPEAEILFHRSPAVTSKLFEGKKKIPQNISYQATYCSPEGLFGIQDDLNSPAYLLMLDLSIFYEFLPVNAANNQAVPLEDIDIDRDYQMVITNCSGLWRCCSEGPVIRFVSKAPYHFILI